jgi:hypothetical protein
MTRTQSNRIKALAAGAAMALAMVLAGGAAMALLPSAASAADATQGTNVVWHTGADVMVAHVQHSFSDNMVGQVHAFGDDVVGTC